MMDGMVVSLWCDECADPHVGCRATDCALRTGSKEEPVTEAVPRIATALIKASDGSLDWPFMGIEESDREALEKLIISAIENRGRGA